MQQQACPVAEITGALEERLCLIFKASLETKTRGYIRRTSPSRHAHMRALGLPSSQTRRRCHACIHKEVTLLGMSAGLLMLEAGRACATRVPLTTPGPSHHVNATAQIRSPTGLDTNTQHSRRALQPTVARPMTQRPTTWRSACALRTITGVREDLQAPSLVQMADSCDFL